MTESSICSSLLLKHPQKVVAEDCRLYGRQIGEPGRLREVGYGSCRLQVGERLVDSDDERRIAGEADIASIDAYRIVVSGCSELGIRMGGAVGVEAAQVEQCGVEVAAIDRAEQVVPPWNEVRDVVDQASFFESHQ